MQTLVRMLAVNRDVDGWQQTATSWLIAALIIAAICALVMLALKGLLKLMARLERKRIWSRGKTIWFLLAGLIPIALALWLTWYLSNDYTVVTGIPGLFKGIAVAWLSYLLMSIIGHLGPWRREIF